MGARFFWAASSHARQMIPARSATVRGPLLAASAPARRHNSVWSPRPYHMRALLRPVGRRSRTSCGSRLPELSQALRPHSHSDQPQHPPHDPNDQIAEGGVHTLRLRVFALAADSTGCGGFPENSLQVVGSLQESGVGGALRSRFATEAHALRIERSATRADRATASPMTPLPRSPSARKWPGAPWRAASISDLHGEFYRDERGLSAARFPARLGITAALGSRSPASSPTA